MPIESSPESVGAGFDRDEFVIQNRGKAVQFLPVQAPAVGSNQELPEYQQRPQPRWPGWTRGPIRFPALLEAGRGYVKVVLPSRSRRLDSRKSFVTPANALRAHQLAQKALGASHC